MANNSTYPGSQQWTTSCLQQSFCYDAKTSQFTQSVTISQRRAFRLLPLTITEGPLKGRHIVVLEPGPNHFRFMDLAPELRNRIYELVLGENTGIFVARDKKPMLRAGAKKALMFVRSQEWRHTFSEDARPVATNTALWSVSKQIYREMIPMLYGGAPFHFASTTDLRDFALDIGRYVRFLTDVRLIRGALRKTTLRSACAALKDARNLRRLTIEYLEYAFGPYHSLLDFQFRSPQSRKVSLLSDINYLFDDLLPLVKALFGFQQSRERRLVLGLGGEAALRVGSERPKAVDILRFQSVPGCQNCAAYPATICPRGLCAGERRKDRELRDEVIRLRLRRRFVEELGEEAD